MICPDDKMELVKSQKIVLISSGQPSLNPRLVKEADTLAENGYKVLVIYAYWNDWGTQLDEQDIPSKKWVAIRAGGHPKQKPVVYFISRLIQKIAVYATKKISQARFADVATSRAAWFLENEAKMHTADLYIAHNLGALPAAAAAAKKFNKPFGFDAEDFHRQEVSDDVNSFHFKFSAHLENKYLPLASYITASSPLIAAQYASLYDRNITTLVNAFPKTVFGAVAHNNNEALKLFWFSQTIGPNRGIETIISAMGRSGPAMELHLLGQPADGYREQLENFAATVGVDKTELNFYPPVKGDEIFKMAPKFDIGLASETGFCLNNNLALSNKIFTYIQCGLAVAASGTPAQAGLMAQYPGIGRIYNSAKDLADILDFYAKNREHLYQTQKEAFETGQKTLNWDNERPKFLRLVKQTLAGAS